MFNDACKPLKKCTYSPHSGLVGCLPVPNIYHLANEFTKGKMFWTIPPHCHAHLYRKRHTNNTTKSNLLRDSLLISKSFKNINVV